MRKRKSTWSPAFYAGLIRFRRISIFEQQETYRATFKQLPS